MKSRISVPLSEDLVKAIDELTPEGKSRSETIAQLLRESLAARARRARDQEDLEAINRHASELNEEVEDVLTYHVET